MWRLSFLCLFVSIAFGQTEPSFDVADIKINTSGATASTGDISNGHFIATNVSLRFLIAQAWHIAFEDVYGPSWLNDTRVDIIAKTASPQTPDAELRLMLRTLLRDRMQLVSHPEQREKLVYSLTVWKGTPKLTPSEMPVKPEDANCSLYSDATGNRHLTCKHMTTAALAYRLTQISDGYVDRNVVDQTGLTGAWQLAVTWTPRELLEANGGLTLFSAFQTQLGLQLASSKAPVPVLVIDRIAKAPTEN